MPLSETVSEWVDAYVRSGHIPKQMDQDLYNRIQENKAEGKLLRVRPFPENGGISSSEQLLQALHDLRTKFSIINDSDRFAFELWFNQGTVQFLFYIEDEQQEEKLRRQIDAHYPNSEIVEMDGVFPDIYKNDWIAGSELHLKQSKYYPIRNPRGVRELKSDPYRSITSDMLGGDNDRIIIQVVMRPAMGTWTHGGMFGYINPLAEDIEEVADELKQEHLIPDARGKERSATSEERQLAENIARQEGLPAYNINIRILSLSPDKATAKSQAWNIGRTFEQSFQEAGDQQFIQEATGGIELNDLIERTAAREFIDNDMILTIPEVATVAHIPNDSIETPAVDWNNTQASARIPAEAEKFEESVESFEGFDDPDDDQAAEIPGQETDEELPSEDGAEPDPFADEPAPTEPEPEPQQQPQQPQQEQQPTQPQNQQSPQQADTSTPGFDNNTNTSSTGSQGLLSKLTTMLGFENNRGFQDPNESDGTQQQSSADTADDDLPLEEAPDPTDQPRERQEPRQDTHTEQTPQEQGQATYPDDPSTTRSSRPNTPDNAQQEPQQQQPQQRQQQPQQQEQEQTVPDGNTATDDNWADESPDEDGWEFDPEADDTEDEFDEWEDDIDLEEQDEENN